MANGWPEIRSRSGWLSWILSRPPPTPINVTTAGRLGSARLGSDRIGLLVNQLGKLAGLEPIQVARAALVVANGRRRETKFPLTTTTVVVDMQESLKASSFPIH